ncbi:importin subunit beta-1-like [Watersipora subatra]|uniref:importin subunit beta-1-like n=1 Tax=Watersipora subatra TaxID=2589382 RepID=UPI00355B4048
MSVSELLQVLEKTLAPDQAELHAAKQYLDSAAAHNLPNLLTSLSEILKNGGNSQVARMQAGIQLKNHLYSKDYEIRSQYQQRWLLFPAEMKKLIKTNVVTTLGSEHRPSQAAQCVASIACAELPHNQWPDLMKLLVMNVTAPTSTEMMKEASLEAIGYICQDIETDVLATQSNEILTAIVHGMKKEEPSDYVRLAATNALLNSLEFTKANFEVESERNFIMQVVCEATQSTDIQVKTAALQCLVKIMSLHYTQMENYMGQALFAISIEAMKSDHDEIALQGIEFWSTVCDEEVDLGIELQEAQELGKAPERTSCHYAKGALQYLVPILTGIMTKQDNETEDDDEWNPCKAAGVSLMLLATCCEDDIVQHVLPFVTQNISLPEWNKRDAAIMAFGSILEGPDPDKMKPVVAEAMPSLVTLLRDSSPAVRDTVAWTIGRVCELLPDAAINPAFLVPLVEGLVIGLDDVPRVAANVAWAFSSLAEAAYESVEVSEDADEPETYCLSQVFAPIVDKLLTTTDRSDGNQNNLRSAAYEALMELIKNSPKDCYEVVKSTTVIILERLRTILQMESQISSSADRVQFNDLQSLLCATLQSVLKKVTIEDAPQISDTIMQSLLQMLHSCSSSTEPGTGGGVQEDAMLAISALIEKLSSQFSKYMTVFKPILMQTLKNTAEYQVCFVAVNCVGDLCRALQLEIRQHTNDLMPVLLQILGDDKVDRSVKPGILSVFGDIALAMGPEFKVYLPVVITTLQQASSVTAAKGDYDMVDYVNELRETCLEAYTGIVQGLKGENGSNADVELLLPHAQTVVDFIEQVAIDNDRTDGVTSAACGLIGDLAMAFGDKALPMSEKESINALLTSGRKSKTSKTKTLAVWATKELRKLKQAS